LTIKTGQNRHSLLSQMGANLIDKGVRFITRSQDAHCVTLCLFDHDNETRHIMEPLGDGFFGIDIDSATIGTRYGFRAKGLWAPHEGLRFNDQKLLIDPFALSLDSSASFSKSLFSHAPQDPAFLIDSAPLVPKAVVVAPAPFDQARKPFVSHDRRVIYEAHIKGLTQNHPDIPKSIRGTVAALAHPAIIAHLHSLSVTSLELLPLQARLDERHLWQRGLTNYWGYNPVCFGALEPSLCPGGYEELLHTTETLAAEGIEIILDVVFNHSCESDEWGPTISLRGLDNRHYYRLQKSDPSLYENQAGTGNVLKCDDETVIALTIYSLRQMALRGGVSGFRFDLMSVLGRNDDGFNAHAPLLEAIANDPVLGPLLMIAEPWDLGVDGYQAGRFLVRYCEWNDAFRQTMRAWWRHDPVPLGEYVTRISGSSDRFANPARSVNYITAHDGFTLADLTAFNHKHNEANGEDNRDGCDHNISDNHGHEGFDFDTVRQTARLRSQKAFLASLYLSKGTPMLAMGSEFGHSQGGNNNAYAQDNGMTWLNWQNGDKSLLAFAQTLGDLRNEIRSIGAQGPFTGALLPHHPYQDVTWLNAQGQHIEAGPEGLAQWQDQHLSGFGMLIAEEDEAHQLSRHLIIWHRGHTIMRFDLPPPRFDQDWVMRFDSADGLNHKAADGYLMLNGRQVIVLTEQKAKRTRPDHFSDATLKELAQKAGIQTQWHDLEGRFHEVPNDSLHAILKSMGWESNSQAQAYESLRGLADSTDRRAFPAFVWADEGADIRFKIAAKARSKPKSVPVLIKNQAGDIFETWGQTDEPVTAQARDNRPFICQNLRLNALICGSYQIQMIDNHQVTIWLTIAPTQAYLSHEPGQRLSLSAQLYALKGDNDCGMGDLGTLRDAFRLATQAGFHRLAIQPLHALFAHDRGRISPYFPAHRGFIDPIHAELTINNATPSKHHQGKDHVDYHKVWYAKSKALKSAITGINLPEQYDSWLYDFGLHCALSDQFQNDCFTQWPIGFHDKNSPDVAQFAALNQAAIHKHMKIQILLDQQLGAVSKASQCGLMRDLAIGTAPDGAEVWIRPDLYLKHINLGAPPDPMGPKGQVWGMPPFHPLRLEEDGFNAWAKLIRANMRHACALRIDHALGLSRQFWVPDGAMGADGAYVHVNFDALLAQIRLISHEAQCAVVAEDLGTVPHGLRERLQADSMLSYRVLCFEKDGVHHRPPQTYPKLAMACASTHDLAPLKGYWEGIDIAERLDIGQINHQEFTESFEQRGHDKQDLINGLHAQRLWPDTNIPPLVLN